MSTERAEPQVASDHTLVRRLTTRMVVAAALLVAACGGSGDGADDGDDPTAGCVAPGQAVSWFRGPASNGWNDVHVDAQGRIWLAGFADGTFGVNVSWAYRSSLIDIGPIGPIVIGPAQEQGETPHGADPSVEDPGVNNPETGA